MRLSRSILPLLGALMVAGLPVLADDGTSSGSGATGTDNAVSRIEAATAHHVDVLTGLLASVPAQAQDAIQRAIEAAQKGHDKALAALAAHGSHPGDDSAETETGETEAGETEGSDSGAPDVKGLMRARDAVSSAFQKSVTVLQGLVSKVPSQASAKIQEALNRVQENRAVALGNLDALINGQKPPQAAAAEHPARVERPEHPDRPERPDRPVRPERPDRPQPPTGRP